MATLTRVLGIPSDHQFAAEHWQPLTRAEAMARNPFYVSRVRKDVYWYTCDRLGADGRCGAYEERPLVCRGYPWYGAPPRQIPLADPDCGYASDRPADEPSLNCPADGHPPEHGSRRCSRGPAG